MQNCIKQLPDREAKIIEGHFIEGKTLDCVSIDLHTVYRTWTREKRRAIEKLAYLFNGDVAFDVAQAASDDETSKEYTS